MDKDTVHLFPEIRINGFGIFLSFRGETFHFPFFFQATKQRSLTRPTLIGEGNLRDTKQVWPLTQFLCLLFVKQIKMT